MKEREKGIEEGGVGRYEVVEEEMQDVRLKDDLKSQE